MLFSIAGSLLGGWILGLFGFDGLVIEGMAQLFGVTINSTGYYFMFGIAGALRAIFSRGNKSTVDLTKDLDDFTKKLDKSKK